MPLMKSRSPKAFSKNVATEMEHGKPQPQALAIAYSVKRKAAAKQHKAKGGRIKEVHHTESTTPVILSDDIDGMSRHVRIKHPNGRIEHLHNDTGDHKYIHQRINQLKLMADGGMAYRNEQAATEARPMPDERDNDAAMVSRNSTKKAPAPGDSFKTGEDISMQAKRGKTIPLKHPKMVPQSVYSTRLRDEEDDLQESASPGPYDAQPPKHDDEEGAKRQGPKVPDMEDEHSTGRKPYAKGGKVEKSDYSAKPNRYMDDFTDLDPSEDEGYEDAMSKREMRPDRQGPPISDTEEPHSEHDEMYHDNMEQTEESESRKMDDTVSMADGGSIDHEMMDQPDEEEEMEHAASVTAAIMAKMRQEREDGMSGSEDMNEAAMYAEGGEILEKSKKPNSHGSMDTHEDADQVDLSRNADEDANEEDQASFNALKKENYSESEGLDALDSPEDSNMHSPEHEDMDINDSDIVKAIRRKMRIKSALTR